MQNKLLTKNLYRPDEVAKILDVSKRTVYRMIKQRRILFVKINTSIRIPRKAIIKLLKSEGVYEKL